MRLPHQLRWRLRSGAFFAPIIRVLVGLGCRFSRRAAPQTKILLAQIKSVLLLRLDEIGDVVLTTPLLRELRRNMPHAWITLVVKPQVYNLVELCPYVNEVLTFDCGHGLKEPLQRYWHALMLAWRFLRKRRFELSLIPRWDIDWYHGTMLGYLSGAIKRVGFSEEVNPDKKKFNRGYDLLLTQQFRDSVVKHDVQHNLNTIRFLSGEVHEEHLELWLSADDEIFADELLRQHEANSGELLIAFGIGAGLKKRQWPLESYAGVGKWLQDRFNARIILIGGPQDESAGREIQNHLGFSATDSTGKATLRQTAALLKRCAVYVGNDAGPMHIAAATRIPIVEISCHPKPGTDSSVNAPFRFGPWGARAIVLQPTNFRAPCIEECCATVPHCILGISVQEVKDSLQHLLSEERFGSCDRHGETSHQL